MICFLISYCWKYNSIIKYSSHFCYIVFSISNTKVISTSILRGSIFKVY
nr:MAG TPA: hypothetical protein [Crassvirales sp.]